MPVLKNIPSKLLISTTMSVRRIGSTSPTNVRNNLRQVLDITAQLPFTDDHLGAQIGGGLLAGAAVLGAGYFAWHEHEKNEDKVGLIASSHLIMCILTLTPNHDVLDVEKSLHLGSSELAQRSQRPHRCFLPTRSSQSHHLDSSTGQEHSPRCYSWR